MAGFFIVVDPACRGVYKQFATACQDILSVFIRVIIGKTTAERSSAVSGI